MKILVTGSNGMIGTEAVRRLTEAGHYVVRLVRSSPNRDRGDAVWDPVSGSVERNHLKGIDGVLHLAGESILGMWTQAKKERLHRSRVTATEFLAQAVASISPRPKVFACASAIGIYGSRGDTWLNETSTPGQGFLPTLTQEWEQSTNLLVTAGIRVVNLRIGIVLSPKGGALKQMLPPFRLGLGGTLGRGRQYMSWITLDDVIGAMQFALENPSISGPVNLTAPNPVTNYELTKTLGRVLHRPTIFPVPSPLLKLAPGRMAEEMLLASLRVEPAKLVKAGFKFAHPDLEKALYELV
jgi:uncharacterized protein